MDYFLEFYRNLDRQGPGDDACTEKAFRMLKDLPSNPKILDVGCGSGKQSRALAKITICDITAVDYYEYFLEELKEHVKKEQLKGSITPLQASMFELPFNDNQFDLIWSEGAIYIMGFANGLKEWKRFVKPGGYIVVSEITWLRDDIPQELADFWNAAYSEMGTIQQKLDVIKNTGYTMIGHFTLPEHGWLENYYFPIELKKAYFLKQYGHIEEARKTVNNELDTELQLYRKYKDYYGYVFYVMQKK